MREQPLVVAVCWKRDSDLCPARPLDAPVPNQTAPRQIVNQLPPQTRAFFHGHGRKGYGPLLGHCLAALLQVIASHGTTAAVTSAAESASVRFK